jgi:hypothetical protein
LAPSLGCVDSTRQVRVKPRINAAPGYQQDAAPVQGAVIRPWEQNSGLFWRLAVGPDTEDCPATPAKHQPHGTVDAEHAQFAQTLGVKSPTTSSSASA